MAPERVKVAVGERQLSLSNLDKVLYPEDGFSKAQVINYYTRIAPFMLPHIQGRCMTLRRWPDGVDNKSFFEKRCPGHRPKWMDVAIGPGDDYSIEYCLLDEPAALVWTANMAALELHAPMALAEDLEHPTTLVFDLDPGEPATIIECSALALRMREILTGIGLESFPKTSGSKGMQVYVPLNTPHTHKHCSSFALAVGQLLAKEQPKNVVVNMAKAERPGKVFVDWSQNSHHKTTIAPYSLRAKPTPTVSAPLRWDEVAEGADGRLLSFRAEEVLERVEEHGDLFAGVLELEQSLPNGG